VNEEGWLYQAHHIEEFGKGRAFGLMGGDNSCERDDALVKGRVRSLSEGT